MRVSYDNPLECLPMPEFVLVPVADGLVRLHIIDTDSHWAAMLRWLPCGTVVGWKA